MGKTATFGGIDILRFVAALLVVLFHHGFWAWASPEGMTGRVAAVDAQWQLGTVFSGGWVGVQIFFAISGFVIAFSAEHSSPSRFAVARFRRLVPAVLICAPITALVLIATDQFGIGHTLFLLGKTLIFYPFSPWVGTVYWTLGVEICFYAVVWLLLAVRRFDLIEAVSIALGVLSSAFWFAYFPLSLERYAETRVLDLLYVHYSCFFATGVLLWSIRFKGYTTLKAALVGLFTLAALLQIVASALVMGGKVGYQTSIVSPVVIYLGALGFITWSLWLNMNWSALRQIGMATYPLYLIHNIVGAALIGVLYRAGMPYELAMVLIIAVAVSFSWIVAVKLEPAVRATIDWLVPILRRRPA